MTVGPRRRDSLANAFRDTVLDGVWTRTNRATQATQYALLYILLTVLQGSESVFSHLPQTRNSFGAVTVTCIKLLLTPTPAPSTFVRSAAGPPRLASTGLSSSAKHAFAFLLIRGPSRPRQARIGPRHFRVSIVNKAEGESLHRDLRPKTSRRGFPEKRRLFSRPSGIDSLLKFDMNHAHRLSRRTIPRLPFPTFPAMHPMPLLPRLLDVYAVVPMLRLNALADHTSHDPPHSTPPLLVRARNKPP